MSSWHLLENLQVDESRGVPRYLPFSQQDGFVNSLRIPIPKKISKRPIDENRFPRTKFELIFLHCTSRHTYKCTTSRVQYCRENALYTVYI
jgi:hypothetical protein